VPSRPSISGTPARILIWTATALAVAVALIVSMVASGAADAPLLADPGIAVRWGLPAATILVHLCATVAVGCFAVAATVLVVPATARARRLSVHERADLAALAPASSRGSASAPTTATATASGDRATAGRAGRAARRHEPRPPTKAWTAVVRVGAVAAALWGPAAVAQLLLTHLSVIGDSLSPGMYGSALWQFVSEIELGTTLTLAAILALVVGILGVATTTANGAAWTAALGIVALLPPAFTGHAAGAANHEVAVSGMWLHLGGIVLWMGGLAGVLVASGHLSTASLAKAARRYSGIASWAALIVVFSGIQSADLRINNLGELLTTAWGGLLTAKIVGTGLLLLAGGWHRARTLRMLDDGVRSAFTRLAVAEMVVMGAVMGVATTLGSSAPPVPIEPPPDPTPTYTITNSPVPPYPSVSSYLTQWRPDSLFLFLTIAGILAYTLWLVRLRRRGDSWPVGRAVAWYAGMLLFGYLTCGGPTIYGEILFSAHMMMHMSLAMVVPILIALAAPVTLALRALPIRMDGSMGPREWLLAVVSSRWVAAFSHPVFAGVNFTGSLFVFYFTPLFQLALSTHLGHILMVLHFSLAGYAFVNALIGVDPGPKRLAHPFRLVLLIATMASHAFFAIAVMQSSTLLAADYFGWLGLPWGVDAMADQEAGGALTWGIGELPTLALAIGVAISWSTSEKKEARRVDRRADADDDAELKAYNEMLAARAKAAEAARLARGGR
jgi:putative copper resistance protein D